MSRVTSVLAALAFAALALPASASGRQEPGLVEEITPLTILLVARAGSDSSDSGGFGDLSSRFLLEIPAYLWNRFSAGGRTVESTTDTSYRESGRRETTRERLGEYEILRIKLRLVMPRPSAPPSETVSLRFTIEELLGAGGEVTMQPARYALLRAVKQSGRSGGKARVLSVEREGARGFSASVLFR